MTNPLQRLIRALAELAETEFQPEAFLPNGRKAHLLYGKMYAKMDQEGRLLLPRPEPNIATVPAKRCHRSGSVADVPQATRIL